MSRMSAKSSLREQLGMHMTVAFWNHILKYLARYRTRLASPEATTMHMRCV